jgi:hypothetical protein
MFYRSRTRDLSLYIVDITASTQEPPALHSIISLPMSWKLWFNNIDNSVYNLIICGSEA